MIYEVMYTQRADRLAIWMTIDSYAQSRAWTDVPRASNNGWGGRGASQTDPVPCRADSIAAHVDEARRRSHCSGSG
jgi:hypothetical protein